MLHRERRMGDRRTGTSEESGQRSRRFAEAVAEWAIYMLDRRGKIVSWNAGAERLYGFRKEEVLESHFSRFYSPKDARSGVPQHGLDVARCDGRFESEGWRCARDGRRFWAQVVIEPIHGTSGTLQGFVKITCDLTERQAAREALRLSEERFQLLVQGVTDYAIYMLDPTGIVTSWNAGAERIKGFAPQQVIGTHFARFYRPSERAENQPAQALATAAREGRYEHEGWRLRADGGEFRAHVVIDPIRDDSGALIGFAKITRDVTERYQASLALERAQQALSQAQKLDAIGQLTGGVAHDFNNLLTVILSSLELIRRRLPKGDTKLERLTENAIAGAKRGASLTQRMLAFARRQELRPEAVDIPALVTGMSDMLERSLGPTIVVTTRFAPRLGRVLIDANQFELAILNLGVNARDAMPKGGSLVLTADEQTVEPGSGSLAPGAFIRFCVEDSGTGMDPETLQKATEPFFTTKGIGKGTGLGLPMVHGFAAQSGGELRLKSAPGAGTVAELWLPVAHPAHFAERSMAAPQGVERSPTRPLTVLAVDDDSLVLASTVAMLEELGHSTHSVASADAALELLQRTPEIDLIVTDHAMPGVTGLQLVEHLRVDRPSLAVILASGYAELPATAQPISRLSKPFTQTQLRAAVDEALDTIACGDAKVSRPSATSPALASDDTGGRAAVGR